MNVQTGNAPSRGAGFTSMDEAERARIRSVLDGMRDGGSAAPAPVEPHPGRRGPLRAVLAGCALIALGGFAWSQLADPEARLQALSSETPAPAAAQPPAPAPGGDAAHRPSAPPPAPAGKDVVLEASGQIVADRMATVSASVTGKLAELLVEEGDVVQADQPIARLDTEQSERNLQSAEARVEAARRGAAVSEAQLGALTAKIDRTRQLAERGVIAAERLEDALAQIAIAEAELASQRQQIAVEEQQVQIAKQEIADATVRAPFAGIVTELSASAGEIISPMSAGGGFTRTGIGTIVDFDSLVAEIDVGEQYIAKLTEGQPAELVTPAYPERRLEGRLRLISPSVNTSSASVKVRVDFDDPQKGVFPGMRVDAAFLSGKNAELAQASTETGGHQ